MLSFKQLHFYMDYLKREHCVVMDSCESGLYCFHIPIWDRMEREISDALLPVAFSAAWMLVAKKYVLPAVLI